VSPPPIKLSQCLCVACLVLPCLVFSCLALPCLVLYFLVLTQLTQAVGRRAWSTARGPHGTTHTPPRNPAPPLLPNPAFKKRRLVFEVCFPVSVLSPSWLNGHLQHKTVTDKKVDPGFRAHLCAVALRIASRFVGERRQPLRFALQTHNAQYKHTSSKRHYRVEFPLRLSRACLGKTTTVCTKKRRTTDPEGGVGWR
jgi:hypothetical protein